MRKRSVEKARGWPWWLVAFLAIFIFGFFTYATSKEIRKKRTVEKEINLLKEQAEKIEKENVALQDKIAYLGSADYQKIQAKDKLNLQSPDENVVVVSSGPVRKEEEKNSLQDAPALSEKNIPNFKKWLDFFFK